jgi:hypothetical protein
MLRSATLICALLLGGCAAPETAPSFAGSGLPAADHGGADPAVSSPAQTPVAEPLSLDRPLDTELVAQRGDVVLTSNAWTLRYEGTLRDGRLRFLETVETGVSKDAVFDPLRSRTRAYPFGRIDVQIVSYTPEQLVYRIEPAD